MVGGTSDSLRSGSGTLLRQAVNSIVAVDGASATFTTLVTNYTVTPVDSVYALANATANSTQVNASGVTAGSSQAISANDALNAPLQRRQLQAGSGSGSTPTCNPVVLPSSGSLTVPFTKAYMTVDLPASYFSGRGAYTREQIAALIAELQAEFYASLANAAVVNAAMSSFTAEWSKCTGMPDSSGVLAAISVGISAPAPVPAVRAQQSDAPTGFAGFIGTMQGKAAVYGGGAALLAAVAVALAVIVVSRRRNSSRARYGVGIDGSVNVGVNPSAGAGSRSRARSNMEFMAPYSPSAAMGTAAEASQLPVVLPDPVAAQGSYGVASPSPAGNAALARNVAAHRARARGSGFGAPQEAAAAADESLVNADAHSAGVASLSAAVSLDPQPGMRDAAIGQRTVEEDEIATATAAAVARIPDFGKLHQRKVSFGPQQPASTSARSAQGSARERTRVTIHASLDAHAPAASAPAAETSGSGSGSGYSTGTIELASPSPAAPAGGAGFGAGEGKPGLGNVKVLAAATSPVAVPPLAVPRPPPSRMPSSAKMSGNGATVPALSRRGGSSARGSKPSPRI